MLTKNRDHDLDCVHGLLILYMMFMHLLGFAIGTVSKYYYPLTHFLSFFMAWFYFKAGMFYKERTIVDALKKSCKRLLLPAIIYSFMGFLLYAALNDFRIDIGKELCSFYHSGAMQGNNPIWFLYSLFFVQFIYHLFRKINITSWVIPAISGGLYALALFLDVDSVLFINVPLGLIFYSLGVILVKHQYHYYLWIASIIAYVVLGLIPSVSDFRRGVYDPFVIGFLWSLCSCIAVNGLFKRFTFLCVKPLIFVGQNAMTYFGTHWMVILMAQAICATMSLGRSLSMICYMGVFGCYLLVCSLVLYRLKTMQSKDRDSVNNNLEWE